MIVWKPEKVRMNAYQSIKPMRLSKQEFNFEDFYVPEVLYKYREWKDPFHQAIVKDRILYLSPPKCFEDKLDCKIPVRYDLLSEEEIYERCLKRSKEINPHFGRQLHRQFARDCFKNSPLRNPKVKARIEDEFWEKFNRAFGVLCLTPNPANYDMWEKYTGGHEGFCVGFRGRELLSKGDKAIGFVDYYDELPIINPDLPYDERGIINVFSKLKEWEFENEFRVAKINPEPKDDGWRKVEVEPENFAEIIFGALMPEQHKREIFQVAKEITSNIKFREAEIDEVKRAVLINDLNI